MRFLPALLLFAALFAPTLAHAANTDRERAESLFREGRAAAQSGDWAAACAKFDESERLDPSPGTMLNLGDCSEHLGKLVIARDHFRAAIDKLGPHDARLAPAKERLRVLEEKIARLTVTIAAGAPEGTRVTLDGHALEGGEIGRAMTLDPGEHTLVLTSPGRPDVRRTITLAEGASESVALAPGEAPVVAPPPAPPAPASHGTSMRTAGWIIGGVGVAGLVVAGVSGLVLMSEKSTVDGGCHGKIDCSPDALDAINANRTWVVVNTVAWIVGAAGVAGGLVLVLASPSGGASAKVGATVLPGGGGANATVAF
jgi:hypothetical protein